MPKFNCFTLRFRRFKGPIHFDSRFEVLVTARIHTFWFSIVASIPPLLSGMTAAFAIEHRTTVSTHARSLRVAQSGWGEGNGAVGSEAFLPCSPVVVHAVRWGVGVQWHFHQKLWSKKKISLLKLVQTVMEEATVVREYGD